MQKRNSVLILFSLITGFFLIGMVSFWRFFSGLFGRKPKPIRENSFLDSLNFLFQIGPKSFWKYPTGIKMGRSISTFLHYIFAKGETFSEITPKTTSTRKNHKTQNGFTLIETIVSITLFATILVIAFGALGGIGSSRVRVSNTLDLNKDAYYAIEKFAGLVKQGGMLDYEEYWNRIATNSGQTNIFGSGHYAVFSGYGNYWTGGTSVGEIYKCFGLIGSGGCMLEGNQKYGEYRLQFIDYGAIDNNGKDITSEDDVDRGMWPAVFTGWENTKELYLINKTKLPYERTFFRLNVTKDPGNTLSCDGSATNSGCIGNLQMLRLDGIDSNNDGKTDSWKCTASYCEDTPTETNSGWVDVFPSYLNVKDIQFFPSPNKNADYAWSKEETQDITAPYVRVLMKIGFSADRRKQLRWSDPTLTVSTTINLE